MQCPKCHFQNEEGSTECLRCGIVFAKYHHQEEPSALPAPSDEDLKLQKELRTELQCRILGIPIALAVMRLGIAESPAVVRILTMLVHETGHAVTAWFCGFSATPGLWFTPISEEREAFVTVILLAAFAGLGFWAWKMERPYILALSALGILLHVICRGLPYNRAQVLITFMGDGGMMVLGSLLMLTMYVSRESPVYENELRWGFLAIGAAAWMDAFHSWSGSEEDIPFGVQEGTQTDPSVLVENYGWTIPGMMQTYVRLAELCLVAVAIVYVIGIIRTRRDLAQFESSGG